MQVRGAFSSVPYLKNGVGAGTETRTPDSRITNAVLYRLSYPGARPASGPDGRKDTGNGLSAKLAS